MNLPFLSIAAAPGAEPFEPPYKERPEWNSRRREHGRSGHMALSPDAGHAWRASVQPPARTLRSAHLYSTLEQAQARSLSLPSRPDLHTRILHKEAAKLATPRAGRLDSVTVTV